MGAMKAGFTEQDKLDEMEYDAMQDKAIEHMYCTNCGETPDIWPIWTGKENWYAGECKKCNDYAEFVLDPEDRSEV